MHLVVNMKNGDKFYSSELKQRPTAEGLEGMLNLFKTLGNGLERFQLSTKTGTVFTNCEDISSIELIGHFAE